uniref:Ig-like domain-containing protein n=1 Tax=Cyprinus carpio TaxID=7962 RepID=A0A8C1QQC1_CYPCA
MFITIFFFKKLRIVFSGTIVSDSIDIHLDCVNGETLAETPEVSAVTTLDGQQIDYYDSVIKKLIPKKDWMKEFASGDQWKEDTEIRKSHGYDGEDFITPDLKELRYITPVPQGKSTVMKWNNDRERLELLKQYYEQDCVYWLKEFLSLRKVDLERRGTPEVSLLHKDPFSPVVCHASDFYPSAVTITWLRNGEDHHEDVELGELLPNKDMTFQKTVTLRVTPDESEKHQYVCVVEHETGNIRRNLTEDEIKSNYGKLLIVWYSVMVVLWLTELYHKKYGSNILGFTDLT